MVIVVVFHSSHYRCRCYSGMLPGMQVQMVDMNKNRNLLLYIFLWRSVHSPRSCALLPAASV